MAVRILVGYDGRGPSRDALAFAALLRQVDDVELVIGVVVPQGAPRAGFHPYKEALSSASAESFAQASSQLKALDPTLAAEHRAIGGYSPAEGLRELAVSEDADLIVVGATHRGPVGGIVAGRTADDLIAEAPCAFAVAPRGYAERADRDLRIVGLAYDGSAEAKRAARVARWLAVESCSPLRAFGVVEPLTRWITPGVGATPLGANFMRESVAEALDGLIQSLPPSVGGQRLILAGEPARALLHQGPRAADVMVFGTRGFGRFLRAIGGSVTSEVIRGAPWPVIVVPPTGPLPTGAEPAAGPAIAGNERSG